MKRFELFHLSLIPRSNLFVAAAIGVSINSREEWLRAAFGARFEFRHRKKQYYWVPSIQVIEGSHLIGGTVARSRLKVHHKSPDEGAAEVISDEWQGAIVLIDPTSHDDGQKVAFEQDYLVGTSQSILTSLVEHVNAELVAPYSIVVEPIWDKATFWTWADAHGQRVRQITFDFVVPNMWGSSSDLDEDLKELGEDTNARTAKVKLESPDGVRTDSRHVKEGVEYAARGGGVVNAHSLDGATYRSTDTIRTTSLPALPGDVRNGWDSIIQWARRILGRGQGDSLAGRGGADDGSAIS